MKVNTCWILTAIILLNELTRSAAVFQFMLPMLNQGVIDSIAQRKEFNNKNAAAAKTLSSFPRKKLQLGKTLYTVNDLSSVSPSKADQTTYEEVRAYLKLKSNLQHIIGKRKRATKGAQRKVNPNSMNNQKNRTQFKCRLFSLGKFYSSKPKDLDCV
jgi:hypothetical protein